MITNLNKIDAAKKLINSIKSFTKYEPPKQADGENGFSEAGKVIHKLNLLFDELTKADVMSLLGSKIEEIFTYFKHTDFIVLEPTAFLFFLKIIRGVFESKEHPAIAPFVCKFIKTVVVVNTYVVDKSIEKRHDELVKHCCLPTIRATLFELFLAPQTFEFKSYFGGFDRQEEFLFFNLEKLLIEILSAHESIDEKASILGLMFTNSEVQKMDYFPLNLYLYSRELKLGQEYQPLEQKFFDCFLLFLQTDLHDKISFLFSFLNKYIQVLSESDLMNLSNFLIKKFEKINHFDFKLTAIHFMLINQTRSALAVNHINYIEGNFHKYKLTNDLVDNLSMILDLLDWSTLQGVEVDPERPFEENSLLIVSNIDIINKVYILRFIGTIFNKLKPKSKVAFINKVLAYFKGLFENFPGIRSSLLYCVFESIFNCKEVEIKDIQMELTYFVFYYFDTDEKYEEPIYRIVAKEMFSFFVSSRSKQISYQLLFNVDYFFKFVAHKSHSFVILTPYVLTASLNRRFLDDNRSLFFGVMQRLLQILDAFKTMPVLYIKNANEACEWLKKDELKFHNLLTMRFFEKTFVDKFVLTDPKDAKKSALPNEYFFFLSSYWSKCPETSIRHIIFESLLGVLAAEFDTPFCANFFNVIDFLEYLALNFIDLFCFNSLNKKVIALLEFCKSKNYSYKEVHIAPKVCHLFRLMLLFIKAYYYTPFTLPESLAIYLDKCFPEAFLLFQKCVLSILLEDDLKSQTANLNEAKECDELRFIGPTAFYRKLTDGQYVLRDLFGKYVINFSYKFLTNYNTSSSYEHSRVLNKEITELFLSGDFDSNLLAKKMTFEEKKTLVHSLVCSLDSTEIKNLFKSGVLYMAPGQTKWEEVYANSEITINSENYQQFIGSFCENTMINGYYAKIDNFMDQFKIFVGSRFGEQEVFEKRRQIGNAPFLIIFDESEASTERIQSLTTDFNVFVVIVRQALSNLFTIEVINKLAQKIPPVEFSDLLFRMQEAVDFVRLLLIKYSKYVDEVLFQEKSFHSLESNLISNSLERRSVQFAKIQSLK